MLDVLGGLRCRFIRGDKDGCAAQYAHLLGKNILLHVGSEAVASASEQGKINTAQRSLLYSTYN